MRLEDMKKDIPETPEFIHTMIQSEVKKQLQDTKVVNIQTRRVKKWTGARVAAAIAVCVLATSTIAYAGTKLYHMFLEKQGAYSIVTGIKADGSTGKINLPEKPKKIIKNENFKTLQNQIYEYLPKILNDLVKQENFTSLLEILSWSNSKVLKFKQLAKKFSTYRDSIYLYSEDFLEKYKEKNENMDELQDIQVTYQEFLKNFPKFE